MISNLVLISRRDAPCSCFRKPNEQFSLHIWTWTTTFCIGLRLILYLIPCCWMWKDTTLQEIQSVLISFILIERFVTQLSNKELQTKGNCIKFNTKSWRFRFPLGKLKYTTSLSATLIICIRIKESKIKA